MKTTEHGAHWAVRAVQWSADGSLFKDRNARRRILAGRGSAKGPLDSRVSVNPHELCAWSVGDSERDLEFDDPKN